MREVARQRSHRQIRIDLTQRANRLLEKLSGNIYRHIAGRAQISEQAGRLATIAGAQIDHLETARQSLADRFAVSGKDCRLGSRRVVLIELTDCRKQGRAKLVVEELGRHGGRLVGQCGQHMGIRLAALRHCAGLNCRLRVGPWIGIAGVICHAFNDSGALNTLHDDAPERRAACGEWLSVSAKRGILQPSFRRETSF